MDESEESIPLTATDSELRELLGLFDAPAFARRGLEWFRMVPAFRALQRAE